MGYKGIGDYTKIHYSNVRLKWKPLCGTKGYRVIDNWKIVTCIKCLAKRRK